MSTMGLSFTSVLAITIVIASLCFAIPLILAEVFPWKLLWAQRNARTTVKAKSYQGKTVLVTGANGAYGSRAARNFAERDVETLVLVDARDCTELKEKLESNLKSQGKPVPKIEVWQVDMMTFEGCKQLKEKAQSLNYLDHVLSTMGILSFDRKESPEGWETSIQVNYLSNALLGLLLLPLLKPSPSNPNPPVLTFVSSFGIYPSWPTMWSLPKSGSFLKFLSNNQNGMAQKNQYGRSKTLLVYFMRELAAKLSKTKQLPQITVNCTDPGTAWTPLSNINRDMFITRVITDFGARDAQYGANTLTNGVSEGPESHGKIVMDFGYGSFPPWMQRPNGKAQQERVWQETKEEFVAKVPEVMAVYEMLDGN
ncbi:hypothetical protein AC578_4567 [Pseudocercospora eumusae]|uniref:Ketoreductase (KR) domain-containing protein n=1 Tax=Pseudocercospora eumusae TaxID=321146 RepID=A0A139H4G1_9PEZI|nr:hypothetical protein AC578_4567 [Pseudocercospora eumusae]KXS97301.1 hypothetical protein AC578_4567 [Pseudocercospora eumusae]